MPTKIALLNGRLYDPKQKTFEKTNILLINNKISGIGYLPDDDDSTQIDINNYYIFPNIFIPIIKTELQNNSPNPNTLLSLKHSGITGSGIISSETNKCYGQKITTFLTQNQTEGLNLLPLHTSTPNSPQMIGLWVTHTTPTTSIETTNKFNKVLVSALPYQAVTPIIQKHPKGIWHIIIGDINDIPLFNTLKQKNNTLSLSIPANLITKKTINNVLPYIKNQLITTMTSHSNNQESLLKCFPLLETELTITDIYNLYAKNTLSLYQLSLKNVAINHTPHLTIFNPKTGAIHSMVLNGKYSPIK
tara:strand:- start:253 stop:1164 length:912 start_codon:yes stop_codon:yes gene_type:complete